MSELEVLDRELARAQRRVLQALAADGPTFRAEVRSLELLLAGNLQRGDQLLATSSSGAAPCP